MQHHFVLFPEGKAKAVTFSYDDGALSDIRLAEALDKYGIKGTFNLCAHSAAEEARPGSLNRQQVQEHILDKGHEIAVHCAHHRAPGVTRPIDGIREVLEGRQVLEDAFGRIIRGMAYPNSGIRFFMNGSDYETVRRYLLDLGIVYSRSLGADNDSFDLPTDWLNWIPTAHHENAHLFEYVDEFLSMKPLEGYPPSFRAKLFYLWGHSFEFDRNNNWERLEEICRKLGGHDDIWYATNGEIRAYLGAYESLSWNVSGTRIYNPSLLRVWVWIDGTVYSIAPGEEITVG